MIQLPRSPFSKHWARLGVANFPFAQRLETGIVDVVVTGSKHDPASSVSNPVTPATARAAFAPFGPWTKNYNKRIKNIEKL